MIEYNITERIGIHSVSLSILRNFGWLEREQFVSDYGIDLQIEIVKGGIATGLLYCLQVKSGKSYIKESDEHITYYTQNERHVSYWTNHSLPVLLVIYDIETDKKYWDFVTEEKILKTEKGWKIEIPKSNDLDNENAKNRIEQFYFSNNDFTIIESDIDTSHALSRRISMKIIFKRDISNLVLEQQIPQLIEGLKKSNYYRSQIVEAFHRDKPADCVWIWFYENYEQYKQGLPYCTAYWNHPESKSPTKLNSNDKEIMDNIFINYNQVKLGDEFLNKRLSKSKYLTIADNFIDKTQIIFNQIQKQVKKYNKSKKIAVLRKDVLKYENEFEQLLPMEYHQNFEPLECIELNKLISNIESSIMNIFIILKDEKRNEQNIVSLMNMYINTYIENINHIEYERGKVK